MSELLEPLTVLIILMVPYLVSLFVAMPFMFRIVCGGMASKYRTTFFQVLLGFTAMNVGFFIWNVGTILLSVILHYEIPPTLLEVLFMLLPQVIGACIFIVLFAALLCYFGYYLLNYHMQA